MGAEMFFANSLIQASEDADNDLRLKDFIGNRGPFMIRIGLITPAMLVLALLVFANSQTPELSEASSSGTVRQTPGATSTLRSIKVNAQTITALPSRKKYVVDLTQRGVKYEFDAKTSRIDFSRVVVRTATGEVAIGSYLKTTFLKEPLPRFEYTSQSFSLETRATGTFQSPPSTTLSLKNFECARFTCVCKGGDDCLDLSQKSGLCSGEFLCWTSNGEVFCSCVRKRI